MYIQVICYRVFVVITFAMISVGRSMAMIPDYSKAKQAALRIMQLNKRQSQIDPHDESGIILVVYLFEKIFISIIIT